MRLLVVLLLALPAGAAFAQYKCTAADGAISFQQTPCAASQKEQKLVVVPNGHPPPASGAASGAVYAKPVAPSSSGTVDQRMRAAYEKQNQRDALQRAVTQAETDRDQHAGQRLQALAAARRQLGDDPANAATLRGALEAIEGRYKAMADIDELHLEAANAALSRWEAAQPPN